MKKLQDQQKAKNDSFKVLLNQNDKNGHKVKFTDAAKKLNIKKDEIDYGVLLRELGFVLSSATTTEKALEQVLKYVLKVKEIAAAGIYFFDMETGDIEFNVNSGLSKRFIKHAKNLHGFQSYIYK